MGVLRWLLIFMVCFFLVLFGVQNSNLVDLHLSLLDIFSYDARMPMFLVVVISVFGGAALGGLIGLADQLRLRSQIRKQKKILEKLENEVKSLRNLPLEEEGDVKIEA